MKWWMVWRCGHQLPGFQFLGPNLDFLEDVNILTLIFEMLPWIRETNID